MTKHSRRDFICYSSMAGASLLVPDFLKAAPVNNNILILIHLSGGNDGLNTVVPYHNDLYHRLRPALALKKNEIIKLNDELFLNKSLSSFASLYETGEAVILNGIGIPFPSTSHFKSLNSWHTAGCDTENAVTGWVGRILDYDDLFKAAEMNYSFGKLLKGKRKKGVTLYQSDDFPFQINAVTDLINSETEYRVYHLSLSGFDTHTHQKQIQNRLLKVLDEGIRTLSANLKQSGKWKHTLVMTYSEFGRSVNENPFGGTEHGNTNTVLLAGGNLKPIKTANEIYDLQNTTPKIDFRNIYATILDKWFQMDSSLILKDNFRAMDFI